MIHADGFKRPHTLLFEKLSEGLTHAPEYLTTECRWSRADADAWSQYYVLGELHYDGGADWIVALSSSTSAVEGILIDDSADPNPINSGIGALLSTLKTWKDWNGNGVEALRTQLRNADPLGWDAESEWRGLLENMTITKVVFE